MRLELALYAGAWLVLAGVQCRWSFICSRELVHFGPFFFELYPPP